jgi:RES domain-containing protein
MKLFRMVQDRFRTTDLRGMGSYTWGGRWNSKGTYMLYTSENSSLAYLEFIVPFDKTEIPLQVFIIELEIKKESLIYTVPDAEYHKEWMQLARMQNQQQGDRWMKEKKFLGIRVRSAVNPSEYNCLLNPLYPGFNDMVKIISATEMPVDNRLWKI